MKASFAPGLGEGSVGKLIFRLALPSIVSQLVNLLYNLVDRVYIGHIPGEGSAALTGLGLCFPVIMLITAFTNLVGSGGAPRAAISMGKRENETAELILGNCTSLLLIFAVILTALTEVFAEPLLRLFGASDVSLPYALSYLRIYAAGSICVMLALGLNLFITTQGFAAVAMKSVLIGAISNIILDPVFIFAAGLGVRGAALATIISQLFSAIWVIRFLTGEQTKLKIRVGNMLPEKKILLPVIALGVSPFIMSATESAINIAFNSSLAKYGGDAAVGAMTILSSLMQIMFIPPQGLAQGTQPIISFNYGARKPERVRQAFRILLISAVSYTMFYWALLMLFPQVFVGIFNSGTDELAKTAVWALRVYIGASGIFGVQMAVQQTFVALGQAKISLFIACLRKIILLIPLIYILPAFLADKVFAVFLAEPVADTISVCIAATLFALNFRRILDKPPV